LSPRFLRDRKMARRGGFTLVEIMITVMIIGLLSALAIPAGLKSAEVARRSICIDNQRVIYGAACQYEMDQATILTQGVNGIALRTELMNGGYLDSMSNFECPSSRVDDYDDYVLVYIATELQGVRCTAKGAEHAP